MLHDILSKSKRTKSLLLPDTQVHNKEVYDAYDATQNHAINYTPTISVAQLISRVWISEQALFNCAKYSETN